MTQEEKAKAYDEAINENSTIYEWSNVEYKYIKL